jgi:drug/metabolite transporter (DMT)-like permease
MTRSAEARLWQALGLAVGVVGGLLLAYTFGRYGLASLDHAALEYGIASSFMMMGGAAAFLAGRALHVEETHLTRKESWLWILLAAVCLIGGAAVVIFTKVQHSSSIVDQLAMGIAGAFFMMIGALCLVGQRVMSRMHDAWVLSKEEREKIDREERMKVDRAYGIRDDL